MPEQPPAAYPPHDASTGERAPRAAPATPKDTARLVGSLRDPRCYPHETSTITVIETHISYVILTGTFAYKLKKPLKLPFLDFSTLERRKHFCEEELEVNRRFAPDLYIDVVPITGSLDTPRVSGGGLAIEHAVKLRQFDPDATADRLLERGVLDREAVERFAVCVARFHASAPAAEGEHPGRLAQRNVAELGDALREAEVPFHSEDLAELTRREARRLETAFSERARAGAVREGHGDLHLGNVVMIDGELIAFDALEFDRAMRSLDVIDEAAFVVMDLASHARLDLAHAFVNRYLEVTGDYAGTRLLPFYVLYRALVRAKVRAIKARAGATAHQASERVAPYLALARRLLPPRRPRLILTYGLSGSGKTTVTDELVPRLPAIRIRSDLERKRLAGVDPMARDELGVGEGRYDAAMTGRTYAALCDGAGAVLSAGLDVIVDATFLSRSRRRDFAALAERHEAAFTILRCDAPEAVLRSRVRRRAAAGSDASEATEAVLDAQLRNAEPPTDADDGRVVTVDTAAHTDYDALVKRLLHET